MEELEQKFKMAFCKLTGLEDFIPLNQAKFVPNFCLQHKIKDARNEVIFCPFTIFYIVNIVILTGGPLVFCDCTPRSHILHENKLKTHK